MDLHRGRQAAARIQVHLSPGSPLSQKSTGTTPTGMSSSAALDSKAVTRSSSRSANFFRCLFLRLKRRAAGGDEASFEAPARDGYRRLTALDPCLRRSKERRSPVSSGLALITVAAYTCASRFCSHLQHSAHRLARFSHDSTWPKVQPSGLVQMKDTPFTQTVQSNHRRVWHPQVPERDA